MLLRLEMFMPSEGWGWAVFEDQADHCLWLRPPYQLGSGIDELPLEALRAAAGSTNYEHPPAAIVGTIDDLVEWLISAQTRWEIEHDQNRDDDEREDRLTALDYLISSADSEELQGIVEDVEVGWRGKRIRLDPEEFDHELVLLEGRATDLGLGTLAYMVNRLRVRTLAQRGSERYSALRSRSEEDGVDYLLGTGWPWRDAA